MSKTYSVAEIRAIQEKYLPYQIQPLYMSKKKRPVQITNPFDINQPMTKEVLDKAWSAPEKYYKTSKTDKRPFWEWAQDATNSFTVKCGQSITTRYGKMRLMAIDLDENEHPIQDWLAKHLPMMGCFQRYKATGEIKASTLVAKKGSKGMTFFVLVPEGTRIYGGDKKGLLSDFVEEDLEREKEQKIADETGEEVNKGRSYHFSADLLLFKKRPDGPEKGEADDCFVIGAHKTLEPQNAYRWGKNALCDVQPEDLPICNPAWIYALMLENNKRMLARRATRFEEMGRWADFKAKTEEKNHPLNKLDEFNSQNGYELRWALEEVLKLRSGTKTKTGNFNGSIHGETEKGEDGKPVGNRHLITVLGFFLKPENKHNTLPSPEQATDFICDAWIASKASSAAAMTGKDRAEKLESAAEVLGEHERIVKKINNTTMVKAYTIEAAGGGDTKQEKELSAWRAAQAFLDRVCGGDWDNLMLGESAVLYAFDEKKKFWKILSDRDIYVHIIKAMNKGVSEATIKSARNLIVMYATGNKLSKRWRAIKNNHLWKEYSTFSCLNGIFVLRDDCSGFDFKENADVTRDDLCLARFPFHYEPDPEKRPDCPLFKEHMRHLFDGNEVDIKVALEHFAVGMTSYRLHRQALWIVGNTSNGKSTLAYALKAFYNSGDEFGDTTICSSAQLYDYKEPNEISKMIGRKVNIDPDAGSLNPSSASLTALKKILSGEPVGTKILYSDRQDEIIEALHITFCNEMISFNSDDADAIARRVIKLNATGKSVETSRFFDEDGKQIKKEGAIYADDNRRDKLTSNAEMTGFFHLLVENLNDFFARDRSYHLEERHLDAIQSTLPSIDLIGALIEHGPFDFVEGTGKDGEITPDDVKQKGITNWEFFTIARQWIKLPGNPLSADAQHSKINALEKEFTNYCQKHPEVPKCQRGTKRTKGPKGVAKYGVYPFVVNEQRWAATQAEWGYKSMKAQDDITAQNTAHPNNPRNHKRVEATKDKDGMREDGTVTTLDSEGKEVDKF